MRKKLLKNLRKKDYEVFLWLLKELKIKYSPQANYIKPESKRAYYKRLAREEAMAYRDQKLEELREQLEEEKKVFEVEKAKVLAQIETDIKEHNLDKTQLLKYVKAKQVEKSDHLKFRKRGQFK